MFQKLIRGITSDPKKVNLVIFIFICALALVLQYPYINTFPSFIHAWAQADRYSLAVGFIRNGFDFFHPETFVLNHQFPHTFRIPSLYSITSVDFPIHDYIVGIIMHLLKPGVGSNFAGAMPWVFRSYTLTFSIVGLLFFYKLSVLVTRSHFKSLVALIFCMTSPVFVYYQTSFLPSIPSLSLSIIAMYHYLRYRGFNNSHEKDSAGAFKHFTYSVILLTFATLSRTTFAIPLVAVISIEGLRALQQKSWTKNGKLLRTKLLVIVIGLGTILSFAYHNSLLREEYGSIFLNSFMPAVSWAEVNEIIEVSYNNWIKQYFSKSHYHVIGILILIAIAGKIYLKKPNTLRINQFLFLIAIITFGCVLFAGLMLKQFVAHDYYFLDSFFLPACLSVVFIMSLFPSVSAIKKLNWKLITLIQAAVFIGVTGPLMTRAHKTQQGRHFIHDYDTVHKMVTDFQGSARFLNELNIPLEAKILNLGSFSPNSPFIFMNRKGYAVLSPHKEEIQNTLSWDYDYIVFQNEIYSSRIHSIFPELVKHLKKIGDNGKITVCKYLKTLINQDIVSFALQGKYPVFESAPPIDDILITEHQGKWSKINQVFQEPDSIPCFILEPADEATLHLQHEKLDYLVNNTRKIHFSCVMNQKIKGECCLVIAIDENGKNIMYKAINLTNYLEKSNEWKSIELLETLSAASTTQNKLTVYIYNPGKSKMLFKDLSVKVY